jgi:hypothetical protein
VIRLIARYPKAAAGAAVVALIAGAALAQTFTPAPTPAPEPSAVLPARPMPYSAPPAAPRIAMPTNDVQALQEGLRAARARDYDRATVMQTAIQDPWRARS